MDPEEPGKRGRADRFGAVSQVMGLGTVVTVEGTAGRRGEWRRGGCRWAQRCRGRWVPVPAGLVCGTPRPGRVVDQVSGESDFAPEAAIAQPVGVVEGATLRADVDDAAEIVHPRVPCGTGAAVVGEALDVVGEALGEALVVLDGTSVLAVGALGGVGDVVPAHPFDLAGCDVSDMAVAEEHNSERCLVAVDDDGRVLPVALVVDRCEGVVVGVELPVLDHDPAR